MKGIIMEQNNIDKISKALLSAQKEIKHAEMNQANDFFKSSYANLESVIGACKNALNKNGISYIQGFDYQIVEGEHVFYVTTTLLHASGQWMRSWIKIPVEKLNAQQIGTATTYGRRYGLAAMVGVSQYDDDGQENKKALEEAEKQS